jgi:iron(III) transport system permease protein
MTRKTAWFLLISVLLVLSAAFIYPALSVLGEAFKSPTDGSFTFDYIRMVIREPIYQEGLINALVLGGLSTVVAVLIALPLATLNHRYTFPGKQALALLVLVPMILPPFIGAIGIRQILGTEGSLNALLCALGWMESEHPFDWLSHGRFVGIILMNALHLYPILYLNIAASLVQIDPTLEQAAENLGCPPWRRFLRITVPLILPGLFAGASLVFIWAFTELGVPLVFDFTRVAPVQILDGIKSLDRNPLPYALTAIVLLIAAVVFLVSKLALGRSKITGTPRPKAVYQAKPLRGAVAWWCSAAFLGVTLLGSLPHIGVALLSVSREWHGTILPSEMTLAYWQDALGSALIVPAISNSLLYASCATAGALVLGLAASWVIVRSDLRARHLLDTLTMLPLAVPGLVLAFGYLALSQEGKPLAFLIGADGSPLLLLAVAYAMRRLPYVTRATIAGLQQSDPALEQAARSLGASAFSTFMRISLPLLAAHLAAGCVLAFAFSMLEVSDSLILAQRAEHYPITKATFALLSSLGNGIGLAAALGVWSMVFLGVAMIGAGILGGKRGGLSGQ